MKRKQVVSEDYSSAIVHAKQDVYFSENIGGYWFLPTGVSNLYYLL